MSMPASSAMMTCARARGVTYSQAAPCAGWLSSDRPGQALEDLVIAMRKAVSSRRANGWLGGDVGGSLCSGGMCSCGRRRRGYVVQVAAKLEWMDLGCPLLLMYVRTHMKRDSGCWRGWSALHTNVHIIQSGQKDESIFDRLLSTKCYSIRI